MLNIPSRHLNEFRRAIRANKFDHTERGIYLPNAKIEIVGAFHISVNGGPAEIAYNTVVNEGKDHFLDATIGTQPADNTWGVSMYTAAVTPNATWTQNTFVATGIEFTNFTLGARPAWTPDAVSGQSVSNAGTPASFTIDTGGPFNLNGAGILRSTTLGSTTSPMIAAAAFNSQRTVDTGDVVNIQYTVNFT